MSESKHTTKYVTVTVDVIFYGDCVEANEALEHLQSWIEAGLEDRDNLYGVRFSDGTPMTSKDVKYSWVRAANDPAKQFTFTLTALARDANDQVQGIDLFPTLASVLGIDIDIREHNRAEIEKHPMSKRITMLEGSSIAPNTSVSPDQR